MRFFMALFFALNCCVSSVWAQTVNNEAKHQQRVAEMENNPVVKYSRSILPTNKDQKTARNLMIVKEVVNFKMGDENLAKYYDNLDDNKRYNKDMDKSLSDNLHSACRTFSPQHFHQGDGRRLCGL